MKKAWVLVLGGLLFLSMLAATSFVAAAPPANAPAVPAQAATATPLPTDPEELQPEANVDPSAVVPVAPGVMTSKIIVFNPDTATATVRIDIIKPDGSVAYTFPTFTIPANGAAVKVLPNTITSPFSGSAVVSSDKNVQAFVTDYNAKNTARDTYEGTGVLTDTLTLPLVRHLSLNKQHSIIAVQNTSGNDGNVTLRLFDENGAAVGSPTTQLARASSSAYFNTDNLFPSGTFTGSAQIQADPGLTIAGTEQTSYYLDTASFRAQDATDQDTTLYIPLVERQKSTTGALLSWSEIFVRNDGTGPTDIKAEFYPYTGGTTPRLSLTRSGVAQNGLAQFLTNAAEFKRLLPSGTYFRGWAKITSTTGQPISLYALEAQNRAKRLFGTGGIPATLIGTKFACGDTFRISSPSQYSKIVVMNPGSTTAKVTVKLYKAKNGAAAGTKSYNLGPNKVWQLALSDAAFSAAGLAFEGMAVVSSNSPQVAVTVYTQYGPTGGITSSNCSRLK